MSALGLTLDISSPYFIFFPFCEMLDSLRSFALWTEICKLHSSLKISPAQRLQIAKVIYSEFHVCDMNHFVK